MTAMPNANIDNNITHSPPPRVSPIASRVIPDGPAPAAITIGLDDDDDDIDDDIDDDDDDVDDVDDVDDDAASSPMTYRRSSGGTTIRSGDVER